MKIRKKTDHVDIRRIISEFESSESGTHLRKGQFRIDVPFEQAIKKIAKAGPGIKKPAMKRKQKHNI